MKPAGDEQALLTVTDQQTLHLLGMLLLLPSAIVLLSLLAPQSAQVAAGVPLLGAGLLLLANRRRVSLRGVLVTVSLALFTLLPILVAYFASRGWGNVGWHNLMQLELIYSWQQGMDLGYYSPVISYPTFGLIPFAQLSRLFDVSPLHSYLLVNILLFAPWAWALQAVARPHAGPVAAGVAVPVTFLLSAAGAVLYHFASTQLEAALDPQGALHLPRVELRVTPLYAKFIHLDAMTIGLVSIVFQHVLARSPGRTAFVLGQLLGAQAILLYPSLGPIAVLVPLSQIVRARRLSAAWSGAFIGLVLLLLAMLVLFAGERIAPSVLPQLAPRRLLANALSVLIIAGPFLLVLALQARRERSILPLLDTLFILAAGAGAFVLLKMPLDIQYKFLMGAMAVAGVAVSAEVARLIAAHPGPARWVGAPLLAAGTALLVLFWAAGGSPVHPPEMKHAPSGLSGSYLVSTPDSRAVEAFLQSTGPAGARGLIVADSRFPASALLRRPLYINLRDRTPEAGYQMPYRQITLVVKGLGPAPYEGRYGQAQAILAGDAAAAQALLAETGFDYLLLLSDSARPCAGNGTTVRRPPTVSGERVPDLSVCRIDRTGQG